MDEVTRAMEIAQATEWVGDLRVNFTTLKNAASILAERVEELEPLVFGGTCNFAIAGQPCGECEKCQAVRRLERDS